MAKGQNRNRNQTSNQSNKYENLPPMERISKSVVDAIANATVIWIDEQAKTGVPLTLNLIKEGIIKTVKNLFEKQETLSAPDNLINIREAAYWDGLKHGEMRKELAMTAGMTQIGLTKGQIEQVLEIAAHAWDPISKDKEERGR